MNALNKFIQNMVQKLMYKFKNNAALVLNISTKTLKLASKKVVFKNIYVQEYLKNLLKET